MNEIGENFIKLSLGKPDDFKDAISEETQNLGLADNTIKDAITKKAESINTLSNTYALPLCLSRGMSNSVRHSVPLLMPITILS